METGTRFNKIIMASAILFLCQNQFVEAKTAVVTKYDIRSGMKFLPDYLTTVQKRYVPVDSINSVPLVAGRYSRFNVKKGEFITEHHISHAVPRMYPPLPKLASILAYRKGQLDQANPEQQIYVLYLNKDVQAGKKLTSRDIVKRKLKVGETPRDSISSMKQALGKRARSVLYLGQVLSYRDLTTLDQIKKRR